jgi:hypothetical protein
MSTNEHNLKKHKSTHSSKALNVQLRKKVIHLWAHPCELQTEKNWGETAAIAWLRI